jgi:hypothetical protein
MMEVAVKMTPTQPNVNATTYKYNCALRQIAKLNESRQRYIVLPV